MAFREKPCGSEAEKTKQGILGNFRVKTSLVRLVNQVPLFQQEKEINRMNLLGAIFILGQRDAGVGHFSQLTNVAVGEKKKSCKTTESL